MYFIVWPAKLSRHIVIGSLIIVGVDGITLLVSEHYFLKGCINFIQTLLKGKALFSTKIGEECSI